MQPERIGPYLIEKKIGSGGMGNVYLGRHESTAQEAAVKVLPASLAREEGFILRFNREIEALRKLQHRNIVAFYDSGVDGETYYYAMEYVAGDTLTQRIRRDKRIGWREAVEISIQICSALKAAHDAGVIHRDLKPSNLLLAEDGTVKLTDFGVAQVFATSKLTVTGGVIGTAEYMSPEQSQGKRATKRSDIYSLGAVLYVMLTGRPPFTGNTTVEIIHKQRFGRFDRPRLYVPEIPSWLDDLVAQILEKEPEKRPPDAYVLSRALQEILQKADLQSRQDPDTRIQGHVTISDTLPGDSKPDAGIGATLMRDLIRSEIDRQQTPTPVGAFFNNTYVLLALLALLVGGGIWWRNTVALSPEQRFEKGLALLKQEQGDDWLRARDEYFLPLVQADPDQWRDQVQPYLQQVEAYEWESLQTPPRRRGKQSPVQNEPERWLSRIRADWEQGDFAAAEAKLSALAAVLPADAASQPLRTVVDAWRTALTELQQDQPDRRAFVESTLSLAESLAATDPERSRAIARGVLFLYRDDPVLKDLLGKAEHLAQDAPHDSTP